MSFREDREALKERIATLEAELETARAALSARENDAAKLAGLRDELMQMVAARNAAEQGAAEQVQRIARFALVAVIAIVIVVAAVVVLERMPAIDPVRQELHRCEDDRDRARLDLAREEARASAPPPSCPPSATGGGIAFRASATVTSAEGRPELASDAACTVAFQFDPARSECRGLVRCGTLELYPRGGLGFFHCVVSGGAIVAGDDTSASSESHDPRLAFDASGGTLTIGDDEPAWSVALAFTPPNPF